MKTKPIQKMAHIPFATSDSSIQSRSLKILCSTALKSAILKITNDHSELSVFAINFRFGPTTELLDVFEKDNDIDALILTKEAIVNLINAKRLKEPRFDLAKTGIGVGMKLGHNKPDISTVEKFKKFLKDAPSLAYTSDGVSGIYIGKLIEEFNMTKDLSGKTKLVKGGLAAELIIKDQVIFALQNISELSSVQNIEIVGPLPNDIQRITTFSGGTSFYSKKTITVEKFFKVMQSKEARLILSDRGLEPIS